MARHWRAIVGAVPFAFAAASFARPALAADALERAPETINWSGAYVGAVAGYGWNRNTYSFNFLTPQFNSKGFVGGVTAGYDWQQGPFVLGIEGDMSYAGIKGDVNYAPAFNPPCYVKGCSAGVDWIGTGRARLGYAFENLLPYVTGGFAVAHVKGTSDGCPSGECSYGETRWSWTAGAGVEWAMNQQLSLKAEYLRMNFGAPSLYSVGIPSRDDIKVSIVRAGINYHF